MYMSLLTIKNVTITDEITYSVILSSTTRTPILDTATLTVVQKPVIKELVVSDVILREGQTALFDCEVSEERLLL